MLVLEVKEVCDSLQLSCDIDIVQQSSKELPTKTITIMIGSNGERACFAIEILASSTATSSFISTSASACTSCVQSVQATFVFGEEELCNEGIDADVLETLQNRDYEYLRESLRYKYYILSIFILICMLECSICFRKVNFLLFSY